MGLWLTVITVSPDRSEALKLISSTCSAVGVGVSSARQRKVPAAVPLSNYIADGVPEESHSGGNYYVIHQFFDDCVEPTGPDVLYGAVHLA